MSRMAAHMGNLPDDMRNSDLPELLDEEEDEYDEMAREEGHSDRMSDLRI